MANPQSFTTVSEQAPAVRQPTGVAPDVATLHPGGSGGGGPASGGGAFGVNPPATYNHWLNGVGHHIMPGPSMEATATEWIKTGFYARRQMNDMLSYIHRKRTTIR